MKLSILVFLFLLISCGSGKAPAGKGSGAENTKTQKQILASVSPSYDTKVNPGEQVEIGFKAVDGVDSARVIVGKEFIGTLFSESERIAYVVPEAKLGPVLYNVEAFKNGESQSIVGQFVVLSGITPAKYKVRVIKEYPHDPGSYTQGLLIHNGVLYESAGEYGKSSLRKVNLATGKVLKKTDLEKEYFAEGLALLSGKLYQLTWQEQKGFVYNLEDFSVAGEFSYTGEGWGLATDGSKLFMTNGSEKITVHNPEGFTKERTIEVYDNNGPVRMLNEIEWIGGKIWANVFMTTRIAIIDPATGAVEGYVDCSSLESRVGNPLAAEVFNGIALDPASGKIYVTGKHWDKLFEIKLDN